MSNRRSTMAHGTWIDDRNGARSTIEDRRIVCSLLRAHQVAQQPGCEIFWILANLLVTVVSFIISLVVQLLQQWLCCIRAPLPFFYWFVLHHSRQSTTTTVYSNN